MRIVLATPLYPPEIAPPAPYIQELAKRLAKLHEVTIVAYAHLPEAVPSVRVIAVDKRRPLPLRLISYLRALAQATRQADVLYTVNGASVELPAIIVVALTRTPLVFCIADPAAHARTRSNLLLRIIEQSISARAKLVITDVPYPRPEILPLEPFPVEEMAAYEASWDAHLSTIAKILNHGT